MRQEKARQFAKLSVNGIGPANIAQNGSVAAFFFFPHIQFTFCKTNSIFNLTEFISHRGIL